MERVRIETKLVVGGREYKYVQIEPYSPKGKAKPRINIYEKGKSGLVATVKWDKREGINRAEVVHAVVRKRGKPLEAKTVQEGQWYRVSRVYMAYKQVSKRHTPDPFAEVRVVVYTRRPNDWDSVILDDYKRQIIRAAGQSLSFKNTNYEIQGDEKESIDKDEIDPIIGEDRPYGIVNFFQRKGRTKWESHL